MKFQSCQPVVVVDGVLLADGPDGGQVGLRGAEATEAGQRRLVQLMDHLRKVLEKRKKHSITVSHVYDNFVKNIESQSD